MALILTMIASGLVSCTSDDGPVEFSKLPMPPLQPAMAVPPGSVSDQAAAIAAQVHLGGNSGEAALVRTILAVGLTVRSHEGALISTDPGSDAAVIPAWQVQIMTPSPGELRIVDLATLADVMRRLPGFESAPMADLLETDLRTAGNSPDSLSPTLLTALGPGDSGESEETDSLLMSPVQVWLALHVLAHELSTVGSTYSATISSPKPPCTFTPTQDDIVDVSSVAIARIFQEVLDWVEKNSPSDAASRAKLVLKLVNGVLALADAVLLFSTLNVTIAIDKSPLVRTKSRSAGENAKLEVTVSHRIPGLLPVLNCLRLAFAALGVEAPKVEIEGPIEGARVAWRAGKGFYKYERDRAYLQFRGDPQRGRTRSDGKATIIVQGRPQKRDVSQAQPVKKIGTVSAVVTPVPPDLWRDLFEIVATGTNPLGIAVSLVRRTPLFHLPFQFEVQDWEDGMYFVVDDYYYHLEKSVSGSIQGVEAETAHLVPQQTPVISTTSNDPSCPGQTCISLIGQISTTYESSIIDHELGCVEEHPPYAIEQESALLTLVLPTVSGPDLAQSVQSPGIISMGNMESCIFETGQDRTPITATFSPSELLDGIPVTLTWQHVGEVSSQSGVSIDFQWEQRVTVRRVNSDGSAYQP